MTDPTAPLSAPTLSVVPPATGTVVVPVPANPLTTTSWKTAVIGVLAGVTTYFSELGPNLPTTPKEWGIAVAAALISSLGIVAKDYNVSNASVPVPPRVVAPKPEPVSATMEHPIT